MNTDGGRPLSRAQRRRAQAELDLNTNLRLQAAELAADLAIMKWKTEILRRQLLREESIVDELRRKKEFRNTYLLPKNN